MLATDEIDAHIEAGHLFATTSLEEAKTKLGGTDPILNKIGLVLRCVLGK